MSEDTSSPGASSRPPPMFNAPLIVIVMAGLLIGLHALVSFAPVHEQDDIFYQYALSPYRFWAPAGADRVYPDHISGLMTLLSSALLHADWVHVIVNSLMLVAFGTPVARALGGGPMGWGYWMVLFVGSVLGGSILFLALSNVGSPWLVGASGGTSGLIAAAFLLDGWGMKRSLVSREFLVLTLYFVIANVLIVLAGPVLFGAMVSWEAHAGGYAAGALLMAVLPVKGYRASCGRAGS